MRSRRYWPVSFPFPALSPLPSLLCLTVPRIAYTAVSLHFPLPLPLPSTSYPTLPPRFPRMWYSKLPPLVLACILTDLHT